MEQQEITDLLSLVSEKLLQFSNKHGRIQVNDMIIVLDWIEANYKALNKTE